MKNCLGYTNIHIYCVESLRFGAFRSRSCNNILNMGESLLQGWSVVKCAVVHSDGGLVPEIIVDTHYLNSYLCSCALILEI